MAACLGSVSRSVLAAPGSKLSGGNNGVWVYPSTIRASETKAHAWGNPDYYQLITNALETDQAARICHTFTAAPYGWIPEFLQWYDYMWHKIDAQTTVIQNTAEGESLACINTPSNGVYALFAWYPIAEAAPKTVKEYSFNSVDEHWNNGTEINMNFAMNPFPEWLVSFSQAVKVDKPAQICYPFSKGAQGWVGEIRQLQKGQWTKVKTQETYIPSIEGTLNACASVNAGTYVLFGYLK
jgi:hypothetical protein